MADLPCNNYVLGGNYHRISRRRPNVVILRAYKKCSRKTRPSRRQVLEEENHEHLDSQHFEDDGDLSLFDNVDWLINYPIGDIFHRVLDDDNSNISDDKNENNSGSSRDSCEETAGDSCETSSGVLKAVATPKPLAEVALHRPSVTYSQMIENCLQLKGPQTVNQIYDWISSSYPFYKSDSEGWKNAVRHNLSIKSQFRKGEKCQGRSHMWYLDESWKTCRRYHRKPYTNSITSLFSKKRAHADCTQASEYHSPMKLRSSCHAGGTDEDHLKTTFSAYEDSRNKISEAFALKQEYSKFEMVVEDGQYHCSGQDADWEYFSGGIARTDMSCMPGASHEWISNFVSDFEDIREMASEGNCFLPPSPVECPNIMQHLDSGEDLTSIPLLQFF